MGTFHRRNGFILYNLYILSLYTNPTPKPTTYRKLSAFLDKNNNNNNNLILYDLLACFLMEAKKCPHKDKDFGDCHLCGGILSP